MKKALKIATAAVICAGVSLAQYGYNYDHSADFSKYRTYKWVEIKGASYPDQLVDEQIKQTINSVLASKGLNMVTTEDADLFVGYQTTIDKEKQINAYDMGGGWGYGARWGGGMATATTSTINIGQLIIDMYDPKAKQLVWRGTGSRELNPGEKPDKRQKNLTKGVEKILKHYPPGEKK